MQRKFFLALAVLGAFFVIATSSAQAGWGQHSESSQPGESMSSESASPEGNLGASEQPKESMESSEYQTDEPAETGRLPEEERFENNVIFGDDVERQLREGIVTGGP